MIKIEAASRLVAASTDKDFLKLLKIALTYTVPKKDIPKLSFRMVGKKLSLRGFGMSVSVDQKFIDDFKFTFTLPELKSWLEANGAKPFKATKPSGYKSIYD